jgi:hypothetical protein
LARYWAAISRRGEAGQPPRRWQRWPEFGINARQVRLACADSRLQSIWLSASLISVSMRISTCPARTRLAFAHQDFLDDAGSAGCTIFR